MKRFRLIIQYFVRFKYNNCGQTLEVVWPVTQVDTSICNVDVDDVAKAVVLFENKLEVML